MIRSRHGHGHAHVGRARALVRYFRDPSASSLGKLFVLLAVAYVVWPADLVPDVPIVGWLDDLGVASFAAAWLGHVLGRYREPSSPEGAVAPAPSPGRALT